VKKTARNGPCPCGSGKKYKKCCGSGATSDVVSRQKPDYFAINREIAYIGKLGLQRKAFCIDYIKNKKRNLLLVERSQAKKTMEAGKSITCRKGCHFCCMAYVEASIQECEAIVYFLYENKEALSTFLQNYPKWRKEIKKNGDLFRNMTPCRNVDFKTIKSQDDQIITQRFEEENKRYYQQNILCPFFHNSLCSIYEVRPYTCTALVSTSPPGWCRPESLNEPDILMVYAPEIFTDLSFYYGKFKTRILSFMPVTVYEILKNGTFYLSRIVPGLEGLNSEFIADPAVLSRLHGLRI
jgi:hypothetical protein